ncbi:unnamed protein product [Prorocentrum cordatum]|uniref:Uncharacterized protein n=1 Tax=Prorocentrum cordatum TaxID=2364126 RepID=A0ABN9XHN0_9DINO|nr:unnamed protein product [Polarella glacialis]
MAVQGRRSTRHEWLPAGPEKFAVPVPRDAHDPVRRVLDPLELHHRQQMTRHWVHGPDLERAASEEPKGWRRVLQEKRQRRASEDEELYGDIFEHVPPGSRPFQRQLQDARQRSRRLHSDQADLEGPGKFHDVRSATSYTRQLVMDDPLCGFRSGDTAALKPGGGPASGGCHQDEHDRRSDLDFCFVTGGAWQRGLVEVVFYSDRQLSVVKAERLARISKAEVTARKRLFKAAHSGFGTRSDTALGMPGLRAGDVAGHARERSLSLPGISAGPRRC